MRLLDYRLPLRYVWLPFDYPRWVTLRLPRFGLLLLFVAVVRYVVTFYVVVVTFTFAVTHIPFALPRVLITTLRLITFTLRFVTFAFAFAFRLRYTFTLRFGFHFDLRVPRLHLFVYVCYAHHCSRLLLTFPFTVC